jgi:hypothetical protein
MSQEDLIRKLYGDAAEIVEIPQSVTYTEFAAPEEARRGQNAIIMGDTDVTIEDVLQQLPDDLNQPTGRGMEIHADSISELPDAPPQMTPDIAAALAAFDSEAAGYIRSGAIRTNTRGRQ